VPEHATRLVERSDVRAMLWRMLVESAAAGAPRSVVISGPVASGKTAVLQHFCADARLAGAFAAEAAGGGSHPWYTVRQLCYAVSGDPATSERLIRLVDEAHWSAATRARLLEALSSRIREITADQPMVLVLDDAQATDRESLGLILDLARLLGDQPLTLLLAERPLLRPSEVSLADVARGARGRRIRIGLLTLAGVTDFLSPSLPDPATAAGAYFGISGGNPVLLRGLLDDSIEAGTPGSPEPGEEFAHAVVSCVHRMEPAAQEVGRALAVLGEAGSPGLISGLVDLPPVDVSRAVLLLTRAGLISDGWFRHPAAAAALLDETSHDARNRLHRCCARALHALGRPAAEIARHVVAAGHVDGAWVPLTLERAAHSALISGATDDGLELLSHARRLAARPDDQLRLRSGLLRAEWHRCPARAERHLDELLAAARRGALGESAARELGDYLLWYSRDVEAEPSLSAVQRFPWDQAFQAAGHEAPGSAAPHGPAALLLAVARALYGAEPGTVGFGSANLGEALDHAVAAQWALRDGRIAEATERGHAALAAVASPAWGVTLAAPLATLTSAASGSGDVATAAALLRVPLPAMALETPFGVHYLLARAEHSLAIGSPDAALRDSLHAGELLTGWSVEMHGLTPWRGRAAHAYRALGEHDAADAMVRVGLRASKNPTVIPAPRTSLDGLTAAERRVAELARDGRTNREIADSLFLTVSTVEQHLTRVYRKLDLAGRSDLRRLDRGAGNAHQRA
jgi:DNA-binding CsgD family transcriptional regulator